MKQSFLSRYASENNNKLPSIKQQTEQSQVFITNPVIPQKKSTIFLPSLSLSSSDVDLREAKEIYENLVQEMNQVKSVMQKTKCEYREASRKIKQVKIHLQSEIKKIEGCMLIDFKYMGKNIANLPDISYEYVGDQLAVEENENREIAEVLSTLNRKVNSLQDQIG